MVRLLLLLIFLPLSILAQQPYYDDVDLSKSGAALKQELATKITETHTHFLTYTPGIWEADKVTDVDPENPDEVLLLYGYEDQTDQDPTNDRTRDKNRNGGDNGDWNREHTYAKSLGTPNLGNEGPGSDAHHLRPSDVQRNANRGNRKFADGTGNSGTVGTNWYPGDEWKGDVARMLMYMYLRYGTRCLPTNVAVGTTNAEDPDMVDLLLEWNAEDLPSAVEDQRNTYHDSDATYAQGNRNPFIDNPHLATEIWGGPEAQDRWDNLGIFDTETITFSLYPNPAHHFVEINTTAQPESIIIYDVTGKVLDTYKYQTSLDLSSYKTGLYFISLQSQQKSKTVKLLVN
ncbi:endonuclease [Leeuwenhoekiella sp. A16]|uniref:endonuclease n=1 Tax=unclassified Leeuwenhoekiella TaxID=2615029 RepID=UPI003A7F81E8